MGSSPRRLIDPMMLQRIGNILRAAAKEFIVDSGFRQSAALSYYSLFSLVPLLFIAVAVAGFVYGDAAAVQDAVDRVLPRLPAPRSAMHSRCS